MSRRTAQPRLVWGLWLPTRELEARYWVAQHAHSSLQDSIFFVVFLVMHALQAMTIVPAHSRPLFNCGAIGVPLAVLLLQWYAPGVYRKHRELCVFIVHLMLTHVRAAVTATMKSHAAVGWKTKVNIGMGESTGHLLLRIAMVSGVFFRLPEALGLRLPATHQAVIAVVYVFDQTRLGWDGMRLASANVSFFVMHALHDQVDVFHKSAMQLLAPVSSDLEHCSRCPALVLWLWLSLSVGVALPLYLLVRAERSSKLQWLSRLEEREGRSHADGAAPEQQRRLPQPARAPAPISEVGLRSQQDGMAGDGTLHSGSSTAGGPQGVVLGGQHGSDGDSSAAADAGSAWLFPLSWLHCLLMPYFLSLLSWCVANFMALTLAPIFLSGTEYELQCPSRMPTPYVDSVLVHG